MKKTSRKLQGKTDAGKKEASTISETKSPGKNFTFLAGLICAALAFILYANTLGHDFTVDDGTVISNNKITKKGIEALPEIFTTAYRAGFWDRNEGLYRPLSVAMFAIEWELFPENPTPGHWINVLLFSLTAFLMLITLARIFKNYSLLFPLTVTLLFVVHPIHTEVIANIKSRDEILNLLFVIVTFLFFEKYITHRKIIYLIVASGFYFLAFLSKESAITILAAFPLILWFFTDWSLKKIITTSLPFAGSVALYLIIRYSVLGELKGSPLLQLVNNSMLGATSFADQMATAIYIMGKYIYLMIIPHPLSFDYSYNQIPVMGFGDPAALFSLAVLGLLVTLALVGIKKKDPAAFGLLFFFATISLVSNILFLIESTMAERFLFVPSLGILIAIAYWLLKMFKLTNPIKANSFADYFKVKPVFSLVLGVVLVAYSFKTVSRNAEWKNNLTLLEKDVKTSPESARIRYAYGSAILIEQALEEEDKAVKEGLLKKSIAQLEKGVAILPNYAEAWNHLGIAYKEIENNAAAVQAFEKARSYKEFKDAEFYIAAGLAYGQTQKYDLAIADFSKAISIDPANAEAYNNKGLYLFEKGESDSSLFYFDKAIALKSGFYQALYNKGNTLAKAGLFNEAIALYIQSLEAKPDYVDAWLNIGNSYAALNDYNNALKYYRKVEAAEPRNKKVLINIGITYRILGDENLAAEYFNRANQ